MAGEVRHFAINADNVERARGFYESVFEWKFEAWGPPEFYQIDTGGDPAKSVHGALQKRREVVEGTPVHGFECTIAVDDVDAVAGAVEASGGTVVMPKTTIPGVGEIIFFQDTEGNIAAAMKYGDG